MDTPRTLQQAIEYFADPENCQHYIVRQRWPDGRVICPRCGSGAPRFIKTRNIYECVKKHPQRQFSLKVGTIMEDSPLPLKSWLLAMWMVANCKNGVSSYEIARAIGITQKSAWHMLHRVRLALQSKDGGKLGGSEPVEIDETYIGGKARNMHADKRAARGRKNAWAGKQAVMGLLQRHPGKGRSQVRVFPLTNGIKRFEMHSQVGRHVEDGSTVFTDQLMSYNGLSLYYQHEFVNHAERYVDGNVHTNGMENFWALLKRMIKGTYVSVEPFHLFRYLDEEAFRFNEREGTDGERFDATLKAIVGRRVTYKKLTGKEGAA